jgi:hypothetical protein
LFFIKESVLRLKTELSEIEKQITNEEDNIHLLNAEYAYLTSPERLKNLNKHHVALAETSLDQMQDYSVKNNSASMKLAIKPKEYNIKWRYKKGPSKYLTMVSAKKR